MMRTPCKEALGWTHGMFVMHGDIWELNVKLGGKVG